MIAGSDLELVKIDAIASCVRCLFLSAKQCNVPIKYHLQNACQFTLKSVKLISGSSYWGTEQGEMGWDGLGRNGMGWDGMGQDGMG